MKTIGLIGGMSWESTLEYYRIMNEAVQERLGGAHSARCLIYSVDFAEIDAPAEEGNWDDVAALMVDAARRLQAAGADFLIIGCNTVHKVVGAVEREVNLPLIHIADATAARIKESGLKKVGLLGTRFTMEQDFYSGHLRDKHGLEVIIPTAEEREVIHRVIRDELCLGEIVQTSKERFLEIIQNLAEQGAEGVILGCTEIPLLVRPEDTSAPLFDTTWIHAIAAVDYALA